jgi:hypothetical protein
MLLWALSDANVGFDLWVCSQSPLRRSACTLWTPATSRDPCLTPPHPGPAAPSDRGILSVRTASQEVSYEIRPRHVLVSCIVLYDVRVCTNKTCVAIATGPCPAHGKCGNSQFSSAPSLHKRNSADRVMAVRSFFFVVSLIQNAVSC